MSDTDHLLDRPLARGEYHPATQGDLRGPCPVLNSLANHGYLPRDGRNLSREDTYRVLRDQLGLGSTINTLLCHGGWLEHQDPAPHGCWAFLKSPFAYLFAQTAMRRPGQIDARGNPVLDLDQLAFHGRVEHDVSISRRDAAQGDNTNKQDDLVAALVGDCSDGRIMTTQDWARVRRRRLVEQGRDNPKLEFPSNGQTIAAAEIALFQGIFGVGSTARGVPLAYVKAVFEEERLPVEEGWRRRRWWLLNIFELVMQARLVLRNIGN